jgi:drug/metabolite transporter (DMT)-like permease
LAAARALSPTAILALVAVYVLWGSTTPAIKVAVATLPPFAMAAIRFAIAGSLLFGWVRLRGAPMPSAREWLAAAITGALLLVLGNGVFTWCMQYLPATVGALFFSLSPIFMALFGLWFLRERIAPVALAGLLLGLAGMVYLIAPGGGAGRLPLVPLIFAFLGTISWAIGSIVQRRFATRNVMQASAMQMLCSAVILAVFSVAAHERLTAAAFTPQASGAVAFLILGGSILGFSSYLWLLQHVSAVIASTYAYVNPVVSMVIAVGLLHEPFGPHTGVAAVAIVAGVAMMMAVPPPSERAVPDTLPVAET